MSIEKGSKRNIFYIVIFILIIYFEPQLFKEDCYSILPKIDNVFKILKLIGFVIISIIYFCDNLYKDGKIKISKLLLCVIIFQLLGLISTCVNSGSVSRFVGPAITTIVMIMIAEWLIEKEILFDALKKINIYFRMCFIINVISIILVDYFKILPGQDIYFLGIDNRWIFTYLPWITFEFMIAINENNKKKAFKYFIFAELTLVYKWSISAMICSLLWIIVFIKANKLNKYAIQTYFLTLFLNISIVVFKIQNHFKFLLQNILHKSLTLSGRIFLWDKVLRDLETHPFIGWGMQSIEFDKNYFFTSTDYKLDFLAASHAHNSYMTVLYRYGICGLLLYIMIWILSIKKLKQNRNHPLAKVIFISFLITMLLSIFDTIDCSGLYFIMGCAYSIGKIKMKRRE